MHRRLTELECRAAMNDKPPLIIRVVFVDRNGECPSDRASVLMAELEWHRSKDETQEQFKRRVMANAPQRKWPGCTAIIFWPSEEPDASDSEP